ncbi:GNAT family N-acetyltransferase [Emticicia sp. BO119]|uniref:GNAT family N-acetyltransferase n=1 Tax=Emticicia sp. BO119 TaxID=2757768 RepID=UPI0015F02513|nr:GNAT family N-acetyltransferase [Emticicia sp. BO119]MBA4850652.1 GNAT family N-acetyltransferase [Emticicia sp. BO119]
MNSTLSIDITTLQPNDLPALRELYLTVRQATFTWLDTSQYQLYAFDTDTAGELTLVARVDEVVIGFISAYQPDNFIHHLYVNNEFQGQGIGTMLLNTMLENLQAPVRLKCLKKNKAGMAFYERNGFVRKETGVSLEGVFIVFEYQRDI